MYTEQAASIQPASTYDWSICQETFRLHLAEDIHLIATQRLRPVSALYAAQDKALTRL